MEFLDESVFLKTDKQKTDAILYQAMFDETIRLRKCRSEKERDNIRNFLTEAYQLLAETMHEMKIKFDE